MDTLKPVLPGLRERISSGVPTIGICLGMQILFERSEESPGDGVAVLRGEAIRLRGPRIPQMGWNEVVPSGDALFEGIVVGSQFYFANSYICRPSERVEIAESEYGQRFPSAVRKGSVFGVQFHPEKSGVPGLKLLSNFVRLAEEEA
jgi:glutamine amidotransferase